MSRVRRTAASWVAIWALMFACPAGGESLESAGERLRAEYAGPFPEATHGALPFRVSSTSANGRVTSQAQFLLKGIDFERFVEVLGRPDGWCQSLLLHLNVKTCTHHDQAGDRLVLYLGRKYYEHPFDSVRIAFDFLVEPAPGILRTTLKADHGPYGTSKYVYVLNAVRVAEGAFVELSLANEIGSAGMIVDLYLNTLGRSKIGFTRAGESIFGNPQYVRGQEGAAERNVVRYMYALRVTLELDDAPFLRRAAAWFDFTERHPRQLRELDSEEYLDIKRREHENQVAFQSAADREQVIEPPVPRKNK